MPSQDSSHEIAVDTSDITALLEEYPVRCAVLFGSQLHGGTSAGSDVDIAVAFEEGLSEAERLDLRVELTTELARMLGTDTVDVADLDAVRPEIGASAIETGVHLLGNDGLFEEYLETFESRIPEDTHEERMERFDAILERLEAKV